MKQSLQLRLGQTLTMTPQLQQAIRLLQLSTLELQAEIQQVLESNPMLEEGTEGEDEEGEEEGERHWQEGESTDGTSPAESEDDAARELSLGESAIPEDLPIDSAWEDHYEFSGTGSNSSESEGKDFDLRAGPKESLRDHLLWQVRLTPLSLKDASIAAVLIDAIDGDGYLSCPLEEILETLESEVAVDREEVTAVLHLIQSFDPPGVGAQNLQECLLLQLRSYPPATPWLAQAKRLVAEYLPLLARRDFTQLCRRLLLEEEQLRQVVQLIQRLNPRPGGQVTEAEPQYVVPDVIVTRHRGGWKVELNSEIAPRLRVNSRYASLIRRADNSPDNHYLRSHLQEARWFLKSLQSRNETLLKVATAIVDRQRAFLEQGEEGMRPLVLHDIAETLGMHESTISRVTTQKYMHTPRGIYELKYFFSSHLSTTSGEDCSSTAIRALIKRLVSAEEPGKPLSDSRIATLLAQQGIQVARRTVAKYREALSIPPSSERKRLA